MIRTTILCLAAGLLCIECAAAESTKCIGIYKDKRSYGVDGVVKTLEQEGFSTKIVTRKDIEDPAALEDIDAIFLPGGWNAIDFAGFLGRKNLVDFVAQGKGIFAGAFRSGWFRTSNRPLLPEVGYTYFKNNGMWLLPRGDSPLTDGFDQPFCVPNFDHMLVRVGPDGKVFAVDSAGIPTGVYGNVYGGRYVILGCFIVMSKGDLEGMQRRIFMNCIRWAASDPKKRSPGEVEQDREKAELAFLRRETMYNWLHYETGPDVRPGVLPGIRDRIELGLRSRKYRLEFARPYLGGQDVTAVDVMIEELSSVIQQVNLRYEAMAAAKENEILSATREELIADHPAMSLEQVCSAILAKEGETEEDKNLLIKQVKRWGTGTTASKRVIEFLYGEEISRSLCSEDRLLPVIEKADVLLAQIKDKVIAGKEAADKKEYKQDIASIPGLIKQCKSEDPEHRREAAVELGRIGDPRAVQALMKLLNDEDESARIAAVQSLAWMQCREAVPALIEMARSENKWSRRRAAQALGQIGDDRAVEVLVELTGDDDRHVRENAALALGWLRSGDAVPVLLEILDRKNPENKCDKTLMICAIRALGHIKDKRALPVLQELAENADDYPPTPRNRPGRVENIYATSFSLGLQGHSELAIEEIEDGGKEKPGITQSDYLRQKNRFYGVQRNFNFLAGRPLDYFYGRCFPDDLDGMFACLRVSGATGLNCGYDISRYTRDPNEYREIVRKAGNYDLRWFDTMPQGSGPLNGRLLEKPGAEITLLAYGNVPGFQGFWAEESWPHVMLDDPTFADFFRHYLEDKYGKDFKSVIGMKPNEKLVELDRENLYERKELWAEYMTAAGMSLVDEWREAQEWVQGLRKGGAFTWSESVAHRFKYIGVYGKLAGVIGGFGPQSYTSFTPDEVFMMELAKDGEARAVECEYYNWYDPSLRHTHIGLALQLMHGECYFNWGIEMLYDKPSTGYLFYWNKDRWDVAKSVFLKARKLKEYIAGAGSAANVALVASERTRALCYERRTKEVKRFPSRYYQHQLALWEALQQLHVPTDAIWAETMTEEKLSRYSVLLLSDARCLTEGQVSIIRAWVEQGGVLVATGATSLFDEWGREQKNYALADVFGVDYAGHGAEPDGMETDTYCFEEASPPVRVRNEAFDPQKISLFLHREIKPLKSIETYRLDDKGNRLPGLPEGFACEYDIPLGYDKVRVKDAVTLGSWPDGVPAITAHRYGKGLCCFWTPIYPGLCHMAFDFINMPNSYAFWPGTLECLGAMIRGGLTETGAVLPVEVFSCPNGVHVTIREQKDHGRWIVHLLNSNADLDEVHGVGMIVRPPTMDNLRVYYPDTGEDVQWFESSGGACFTVRDFDVHTMIVVQFREESGK